MNGSRLTKAIFTMRTFFTDRRTQRQSLVALAANGSPVAESVNSPISDAPTDIDCLNRLRFAKSMTDLIVHAPKGTSFRIGLYGSWGEGKTSVMRMMESNLRSEDIGRAT